METTNTLFRVGDSIMFAPKGTHCSLQGGKVYNVDYDRYSDEIKLVEAADLSLPEKLYVTKEDEKFMNKVIHHYESSTTTVGTLMSGTKGSGKTVLAKQIALQSGLPIIVIDKSMPPRMFKSLFTKLTNINVCIIMDEIDKLGEAYDDDYILQVLDGISSNTKHLFLATCNNTEDVNECMIDRCGRIRYFREFEEMSPSLIKCILEDRLDDKSEIGALMDFINREFTCKSFDNIVSFIEEVNNYPSDTYEELLKDMNISKK